MLVIEDGPTKDFAIFFDPILCESIHMMLISKIAFFDHREGKGFADSTIYEVPVRLDKITYKRLSSIKTPVIPAVIYIKSKESQQTLAEVKKISIPHIEQEIDWVALGTRKSPHPVLLSEIGMKIPFGSIALDTPESIYREREIIGFSDESHEFIHYRIRQ